MDPLHSQSVPLQTEHNHSSAMRLELMQIQATQGMAPD